MFWIILFIAGLAGFAYGWIVVRKSPERVTISLELAKITAVLRNVKEGTLTAIHDGKDFRKRHAER
jgi:hypothetical protein